MLVGKQIFPTGGQIIVLSGPMGGGTGATIGGNTAFTISKGGRTIAPA